jgi:acyl-CoA hydrolase
MNWNQLPSQETIDTTVKALQANGFNPIVVDNAQEAKEKVQELLPKGAEVMTMTSETLHTTGIEEMINTSSDYDAIKPKLMRMDRNTQGREMQKLGAAPDIAVGSVHAVTEDGHVLIASRTGSQLPAYAYGAAKVIWVVGTQKLVKNLEEANKRLVEYVLPLESERANKAYNMTGGSKVNKLLTYYQEEVPGRITLILVKESLGF